ncbi:RNA-binding domain-containing protein [Punctularia strigosozonata HHB-11173 SS5]|uniref:RNA-binding domain-containing protein n=1 Tax=Punctularia strigosozonata (strain HHB-11173) TaxID=741275 RepID=UPI0004417369|nr:RNA-binding domain-containing protein [Punctularia strigosozonata HHB-11173 SS5]EIN05691.1 RNA-binding domain-containing protein [Punctularia strigosozonata HHB-11173 SS5]
MSRLIVKNIPSYVTPDRLREYFQQKGAPSGTITDAKVAQKSDGTSRRFGFIGFKTDAEAAAARDWFDRTFLDSSRIAVQIVQGAKDAPAPRPSKRPRLGPSPAERDTPQASSSTHVKEKEQAMKTKNKKDQQLEEFMETMKPRKKGRTWANEEPSPSAQPDALRHPDKKSRSTSKNPEGASPDRNVDPTGADDGDQENVGMSDMDWLKKHMSKRVEEVEAEKAFEQSDEEDSMDTQDRNKEADQAPLEPEDPTRRTILETSRLFLRNLAFTCTEADLEEHFRRFGAISQVHIPLDHATKQSKGLAYIKFAKAQDAVDAYDALDKTSFQGRLLHILPAVERKPPPEVQDADGKKKTVKQEKAAQRKAMAGKGFNWSMLYMNSDAVVSSIADRMNVSKADILNPESDNAAVKMALAETHVISETKAYLESQGVDLASFAQPARSDTIILVKNIPYGTSADDIRALFEPHGDLTRVLVPPAGTMAVVEFAQPDETRKAFKAVAYRRMGNSIIYLERGPEGMFTGKVPSEEEANGALAKEPVRIEEPEEDAAGEELSLAAGTTLFVKNLAFSTTSERLTQLLRHLPSFAFARVQTKPDPKNPNGRLSMGYGFVGFKDKESAKKGMKSLQGTVVDGHALSVKWAGRGQDEKEGKEGEGKAKARTTKMIVKNVPFEATKKDIRELFGAHGQLKSVRLPKKFDHRSRGFAFLDFVSRHEAENAYEALKHTHLLGRHLVLEWASEEDVDVEALRKKAGVGYGSGKELPGRKRKLNLGGDADGDEMEE